MTVRPRKTRFLDNVLQVWRMRFLLPAFVDMCPRAAALFTDDAPPKFMTLVTNVTTNSVVMDACAQLFESIITFSPIIGSASRYTACMLRPFFKKVPGDISAVRAHAVWGGHAAVHLVVEVLRFLCEKDLHRCTYSEPRQSLPALSSLLVNRLVRSSLQPTCTMRAPS